MTIALSLAFWFALQAPQPAPRWEDPHLLAADDALRRKDLRTAAAILQTVIDAEPQCRPAAYLQLAQVRLDLGDERQAIVTFERGVKAHPESPELSKRFGGLLFRKNAIEPRAGELLAAAVKLNAGDAEAHFLYGQWACLNNLQEVCIAELTRAAALPASGNQAKMQIYTLVAMAEDKLNRTDRAEAAFRKARQANLALTPPEPNSLLEYVKFLAKESRDAEAQQEIEELLKFAPQFGPAYLERAKFFSQQGRQEKAAEQAELALRYAGADKGEQRAAHVFLAKTYYALGREEQAKPHQAWVQSH